MKNTKSIFLGTLLSLFVLSLSAQTGAGKILLGGSSTLNFGAYTDKYKSDEGDGTDGKGIIFNLAPQAGFFVMDGLAVGLALNLGIDSYKPEGAEDRYSMTTLIVSPFVRYYYGTSPLKPFAQANVGLGVYKFKEPDFEGTITSTTSAFDFGAKIGAAYFINDNVSFDLGLGFGSSSLKDKDDPDNEKDITTSIGLEIGIVVVL